MNRKIKYFLLHVLILLNFFCFAQQNNINNTHNKTRDSLYLILKTPFLIQPTELGNSSTEKEVEFGYDTTRINTLNKLAQEYQNSNLDSAIILSTEALQLSGKLYYNSNKGDSKSKLFQTKMARSYQLLGIFNSFKGNYPSSLSCYFNALKIVESFGMKMRVSSLTNNIAGIYLQQKDYPRALEYYSKALSIAKELENKGLISIIMGNIGSIYLTQDKYNLASDYLLKVLNIAESLGDKNAMATNLSNIGNVFQKQASKAKSQKNFVVSDSLCNKALNYYLKALDVDEDLDDNFGITSDLANIGSLYIEIKKYSQAEIHLQKALMIAKEINALDLKKEIEQLLSNLFEKSGQPDKALKYYKDYIATRDSVFNKENTENMVRTEMNFEFEKKQAIEKAEQEKQNAIALQEKQKQKIILILMSFFLLLVVVFTVFMYNRWRITQKQKKIIEKQQEKLVDSITYAQQIQQSILLEEKEIQKLLPDFFVYFQPKDIVSGDFYWFSEVVEHSNMIEHDDEENILNSNYKPQRANSKLIIAAVDCTGHGVPGAFMSMIGNTLLNQIVNEKKVTHPSKILQLLNIGITEALHQKNEGALSRDGMEIALCCIDYQKNEIQYAGSQNPLYIVVDNDLSFVNADKKSIGGNSFVSKNNNSSTIEYTNHVIPIKKGMSVYIFSDGYIDQFGGPERKRFGVKEFKRLVVKNQHLSMQEQKQLFIKAHNDWKGNIAQIDDILVIGFKL